MILLFAGLSRNVQLGSISTTFAFSWVNSNADNTISASAGSTIYTYNSPINSASASVAPIAQVNVSTLAVNSFIPITASRQFVSGLQQGIMQLQSMDINYKFFKQKSITRLTTPVSMVVGGGNMYYGLNTGFVQAYDLLADTMTVLFSFQGLPLWIGLHPTLKMLVLHTNGLVLMYNLDTNALTPIAVPFANSNYNFIAGNRLLLTSGNQVFAFDLAQRKLMENYTYLFNTYSIVSHTSESIYFISFSTTLIGAYYKDKQIALYSGFGVAPRLVLTNDNNVIAFSQEGLINLYNGCPTQTNISSLAGVVCKPCFLLYPGCKNCTNTACLDSSIEKAAAAVSCNKRFQNFCLYNCPQAYLPDPTLGCVRCSYNCSVYTRAGVYLAFQKRNTLYLYLRLSTSWLLQRTSNLNSYFTLNFIADQTQTLVKSSLVLPQTNQTRTLMAQFQLPESRLGMIEPNMRVNFTLAINGFNSNLIYIKNVPVLTIDELAQLNAFSNANFVAGFVFSGIIVLLMAYRNSFSRIDVQALQPLQLGCLAMCFTSMPSTGLQMGQALSAFFLFQFGRNFDLDPIMQSQGELLTQALSPSIIAFNTVIFSYVMLLCLFVSLSYNRTAYWHAFQFLLASCELPLIVSGVSYFLLYDNYEQSYMWTYQGIVTAIICIISAIIQRIVLVYVGFAKIQFWRVGYDIVFSLLVAVILGLGNGSLFWALFLILMVFVRFVVQDFTNRVKDMGERVLYAFEGMSGMLVVLAGVVNISGAFTFMLINLFYAGVFFLRVQRGQLLRGDSLQNEVFQQGTEQNFFADKREPEDFQEKQQINAPVELRPDASFLNTNAIIPQSSKQLQGSTIKGRKRRLTQAPS